LRKSAFVLDLTQPMKNVEGMDSKDIGWKNWTLDFLRIIEAGGGDTYWGKKRDCLKKEWKIQSKYYWHCALVPNEKRMGTGDSGIKIVDSLAMNRIPI